MGYFPKLITENRINRFVDEYTKITHCLNNKYYSGEWILTICSADGKDVLLLNRYLLTNHIHLNNVLTDISFYALLEAKKKFRFFSSCFILANSQDPPFCNNTFDICYVHNGLHHLPDPPAALVNLGKKASRLLLASEPKKNILLELLGIQKPEEGEVEYRFTRNEIITLLGSEFKEIKIQTSFIQNIRILQKLFNKIDLLFIYVVFRIAFTIVNLFLGRFGNSMLISANKEL